ncbi:MAG: hypothetical protein ACRDHW_14935, partial [Ktedonobacteraceae bacterium]
MKTSSHLLKFSLRAIILALFLLVTVFASSSPAHAAGAGASGDDMLSKGPVTLATDNSSPLHQPVNLPKPVTFVKKGTQAAASTTSQTGSTQRSLLGCLTTTIDLKVLVVAADGNEVDLPAITQALDYLGVPYTVYVATQTPNGLTSGRLANGCHGYYQGIILTDGALVYNNGSSYVSALSQQEWTSLWSYQANMGVRMVSWYTLPTSDYGYQAYTSAMDTSANPVATSLTTNGQTTFSYLASGATVTIQYAFTYLANALTDGTDTPLLTDASGHALGLVHKTSDGRETLSLTFDSNPNLIHNIVLSYGLINWLTRGLFLGQRHVYMSPQVDDVFIDDSDWQTSTVCGTDPDLTGFTYRINSNDLQ